MTQTTGRIYDEFARLMTDAAGVAQGVRREVDSVVKSQAERILRDLDYVTRDEFEAVKEMAAKARDENERLSARLAELEAEARGAADRALWIEALKPCRFSPNAELSVTKSGLRVRRISRLRISLECAGRLHVDHRAEGERAGHPVDLVERVASAHEWVFDRPGEDEISIVVKGRGCDYAVSFTWMDDIESLHLACAFDAKIPERRRADLLSSSRS